MAVNISANSQTKWATEMWNYVELNAWGEKKILETVGQGDKKIQWFRLVSIYWISINNHSRPLFVSQDNGTENLKGRTPLANHQQ